VNPVPPTFIKVPHSLTLHICNTAKLRLTKYQRGTLVMREQERGIDNPKTKARVSSLLYSLYFNLSIVSQVKQRSSSSQVVASASSTGIPSLIGMSVGIGTDLRGMKGLLLDYQSSIHHTNFQYSRWVDVPQGVTGTVRTSRKSLPSLLARRH
jgi:hypothetical protein